MKSELEQRSIKIQKIYQSLWKWLRKHLDEVLEFDPYPDKMHYASGRVGYSKGSKGKPGYGGEYHREFIRYVETPETIKRYHKALSNLYNSDKELYTYIFLKASGLTNHQIDEAKVIQYPLTKRKEGKSGVMSTEAGRRFNLRACEYLAKYLPDGLMIGIGVPKILDEKPMERREKRRKRVKCPNCEGVGGDCSLCNDGTVPRWLAEKYQEKVSDGTWVDN